MVEHVTLAVVQGTCKEHCPERLAVFTLLEDLGVFIPPLLHRGFVAPDSLRICRGPVHEVRVLPRHFFERVAAQLKKAWFANMIGLPGRAASVTIIGIRVRRTASTKKPPCSRTLFS